MADVNKRFQNWALRTETGRVKATLDSKREDTLRRYMDAVTGLCTMEAKVCECTVSRQMGQNGHRICGVFCLFCRCG